MLTTNAGQLAQPNLLKRLRARWGVPLLLTAIATALLALAACGGDAAKPAGTTGGSLRVGVITDALDFDPPTMVNMPAIGVLPHLYDNLVIRLADGTMKPMLAESWTQNDDASQWTFNLRKGVKFHHGKEFKAEDVIFTINRLFEVESPLSSVMVKPSAMVAVDDYTLRLEFDGPNAVLLEALVKYHMVITPSDVDTSRFSLEEFGTGPFILVEHVPGERTVMKKNGNYFLEGVPLVDEMIFVYLSSPESRAESLKAGTVDVIFDLDIESSISLEADPNTVVLSGASGGYLNIAMDMRVPPFDNILVRKAMQLATDRKAILQAAQFGLGGIAYDHPITEGDPLFNSECMPPDYDPDLAKSLLEQAGYPDGINVELYTSTTGGGAMVPMATVMKEKAAPAGINIEIVQVPETGYWSEAWMVTPFFTSWWGGRPAFEAFSVVYPTDAAWNESAYSNLEVDSLLKTAMGQADLEDQMLTYARLQCIVVDEVPRIIPVFRPVLLGARPDVRDLVPMPDFTFQVRWTWLDR